MSPQDSYPSLRDRLRMFCSGTRRSRPGARASPQRQAQGSEKTRPSAAAEYADQAVHGFSPPPALSPADARFQRHLCQRSSGPRMQRGHQVQGTAVPSLLASFTPWLFMGGNEGPQTDGRTDPQGRWAAGVTAVQAWGQADAEHSHTGLSGGTPGLSVKKGPRGPLT